MYELRVAFESPIYLSDNAVHGLIIENMDEHTDFKDFETLLNNLQRFGAKCVYINEHLYTDGEEE